MKAVWCNECIYIFKKHRSCAFCKNQEFSHSIILYVRDDYDDGNLKYQPHHYCNGDYYYPGNKKKSRAWI